MRGALEDTICAIATPAGEGGIGIVRLSGSQALQVAGTLVKLRSGRPFSSVDSHTLHLADLMIPSFPHGPASSNGRATASSLQVLDEALVTYMKGPRSFTGEDVVEFQTHGGGTVLSLLCRACVDAGARLAEPGEFTKRAFLNGRLDLSAAEGVLDTIRAKSSTSLRAAQRQLRGEVAREIEAARVGLVNLLAHLEAGIDFVEEDIVFVQRNELESAIADVGTLIKGLQSTTREGRLLREGAHVVIVGRPNVGKSSILNRLLKEDRAIVTAIPGTTRDVLEESIDLGGVLVRLVDTAGIRETGDEIEREGIKRSWAAQQEADITLIVVDGSLPLTDEDRELIDPEARAKQIVVINKADLSLHVAPSSFSPGTLCLSLSAKTGVGIEELKAKIHSSLVGNGFDVNDGVVITNLRHVMALTRAAQSLEQAGNSIAGGMAAELVALDIRAAADALGEITGAITTDEILDRVFSEFCIGK
ncbi:MAG TPA: tRNA uridine-5-carboxymethylaminomethyl(34) synthesis GTPase MnmE [Nitrospira sp.]